MNNNDKILCGHQPDFLPWLGVFYKIKKADVFRIADYTKYTDGWTNRVRIRSYNGDVMWLTLPVKKEDKNKTINQVRLTDINKNSIIGKIKSTYGKASYYSDLNEIIEILNLNNDEYISELNIKLLLYCLNKLSIKTDIVIGSSLNVTHGKTAHIIDSCQKLMCNTYLAGQGAEYLDECQFYDNKIKLIRSDFEHPIYNQFKKDFVPGLSVIDAVAHIGWDNLSGLL